MRCGPKKKASLHPRNLAFRQPGLGRDWDAACAAARESPDDNILGHAHTLVVRMSARVNLRPPALPRLHTLVVDHITGSDWNHLILKCRNLRALSCSFLYGGLQTTWEASTSGWARHLTALDISSVISPQHPYNILNVCPDLEYLSVILNPGPSEHTYTLQHNRLRRLDIELPLQGTTTDCTHLALWLASCTLPKLAYLRVESTQQTVDLRPLEAFASTLTVLDVRHCHWVDGSAPRPADTKTCSVVLPDSLPYLRALGLPRRNRIDTTLSDTFSQQLTEIALYGDHVLDHAEILVLRRCARLVRLDFAAGFSTHIRTTALCAFALSNSAFSFERLPHQYLSIDNASRYITVPNLLPYAMTVDLNAAHSEVETSFLAHVDSFLQPTYVSHAWLLRDPSYFLT
jgi:hypothetical protein